MAISGFGVACRSHFPALRPPPPSIYCSRKVRRIPVAAVEILTQPNKNNINLQSARSKGEGRKGRRSSRWKLSADELGISTRKFTESTKFVLNELKDKGYDVYLVGGCVRDLILNRTPKDFDILTSAELSKVSQIFRGRSRIVGKWFPICHVLVDHTIVEVSSFSTVSRKSRSSRIKLATPTGIGESDYLRWKNCLRRDFTINGLMLDPYAKLVYDYMGGVEDLRKAKVRTVIPADDSFREDCARILRAVRIAARLGFRFSKETAYSIKDLSSSVMKLDKGRLLMEMNYMLAFGSAEASLRLLWKVGLLEMLLPFQAAYFVSQGFRRRDKRSNMLLSLFSRLDKLLAPDRPCNDSLWIAILAFHKAISDHPRDPLVVAVFVLTIYSGGNLSGAVNRARSISHLHDHSFPELLKIQELDSPGPLRAEVIDLASSVQTALWMMSDGAAVSQAMAKYPKAPDSDLVFISQSSFLKVCEIFDCTKNDKRKGFPTKQKGFKPKRINYEDLAQGEVQEVRQLFARVVFDTIYPSVKDHSS